MTGFNARSASKDYTKAIAVTACERAVRHAGNRSAMPSTSEPPASAGLLLAPPAQLALAGTILLAVLQAAPAAAPLLEYRRALFAAEPWRLLTGHLVHLNWTHALVNGAAWLLLAHLFAPMLDARRQLLALALGAAFVSLALALLYPAIEWYRGASGMLHALFFAGASSALRVAVRERRWPAALWATALAGGWLKIALEWPRDALTPHADWLGASIVPQAHLAGAVAGTALGALFSRRRRQSAAVSL